MTDNNKDRTAVIAGGIVGAIIFAILMGVVKLFRGGLKKQDKEKPNGSKLQKGDVVIWEREKYQIEAIQENYKDGQNLYAICRMEPVNDVNIKVKCHKILGFDSEFKKVK